MILNLLLIELIPLYICASPDDNEKTIKRTNRIGTNINAPVKTPVVSKKTLYPLILFCCSGGRALFFERLTQ